MSASVSAKADVEGTSNGLGGFNYTIALADIGSTTIGTFWFSWVPGFSYMTQVPSSIGAPAGWTATVVPESGGYSIEWAANSPANYIQAGRLEFGIYIQQHRDTDPAGREFDPRAEGPHHHVVRILGCPVRQQQ